MKYPYCGTLRFSNYAGGETMAWGAMFTILFTWLFQSLGIVIQPLPTALIALPFSILVTVVLILVMDQSVYKYCTKEVNHLLLYLFPRRGNDDECYNKNYNWSER